jgi:hypothetical protein
MLRYVAFLVLGSVFVTGIVTTVQSHRVLVDPKLLEPKVLIRSTPRQLRGQSLAALCSGHVKGICFPLVNALSPLPAAVVCRRISRVLQCATNE